MTFVPPIIGQPRVMDFTSIFQIECPDCKTNFQLVGLVGASAKCPGTACPCAFVVNGPPSIKPDLNTGQMDINLPMQMVRIGPDGRPL